MAQANVNLRKVLLVERAIITLGVLVVGYLLMSDSEDAPELVSGVFFLWGLTLGWWFPQASPVREGPTDGNGRLGAL